LADADSAHIFAKQSKPNATENTNGAIRPTFITLFESRGPSSILTQPSCGESADQQRRLFAIRPLPAPGGDDNDL